MRKEKQLLLDEIVDELQSASAFIVTKYDAIDANKTADIRGELFKAGGSLKVVKKRVFAKALKEYGVDENNNAYEGHVGVVCIHDNIEDTTKQVYKFREGLEDKFAVLGGLFEGKYLGPADVEMISKLPSKDEMRSQLLGLLEAPMSRTVGVMDALLTSVLHCMDNKINQES